MTEATGVQLGAQENDVDLSTGVDFDLEEVDFEEVVEFLETIKGRIDACAVLIGGTPYMPNSRLLAYVTPAVELSHALGLDRMRFASTAAGGAKWNYHSQASKVMGMTDVKLAILEDGVAKFFGLTVEVDRNTHLPSEERIHKLWQMAHQHAPFLCAKYVEIAGQFLHDDHNPSSIRQYGVMHALWAGELADDLLCGNAAPVNVSYGGQKEGAFNWVRQACLHIPSDDLAQIGFKKASAPVRVIDGTYDLPVPYGEARAKLYGRNIGPIDVPLIGKEVVGSRVLDFDRSGPLDVPKPNKRISQRVLGDIMNLIRYIAEHNGLSIEQATTAYIDFWNECKSKYGTKIRALI
ncbi:hypothetical protein HOD30_00455 [Candidatus Peregrinibacteria bacterium]|jgi:hypothetical protein|nr:hypothetical protein [Candidatus Peregrinibacteria bacterium]MBT4631986.1 hypothetical protein [Candidatus Peregrinibacteria bacterium]MBT5516408.1 hypothetical protein [Candidatus Peregrinibacteria bacterium]MBT5823811.1 hypothetical protein [Candidatus Peregrinibacteria bacterium]